MFLDHTQRRSTVGKTPLDETEKLLHQVGDLFELYGDARTYKP